MNKKIVKNLKRLLIIILVIIMVASIGIFMFLRNSLPIIDGSLKLTKLQQQVTVYRDEHGIPSIVAQNELDLYKAQGFIHAQDRLFQMDLARRQASGRLSEVVGKAALDTDKKFLIFSLRKAAEESFAIYSEEAKAILQSYADGVNEYIDYAKKNSKLAYEFTLLGYTPEYWTPIDSLTIGKYMAYDLGGHWSYQAFNNWILNHLGESKFQEFNSNEIEKDDDIEEIININKNAIALVDKKTAMIETPHTDNGSNNWVVAGSKTKSGKPLLADDPHLSLSTPSVWYQMSLKTNDLNVSGVIFAGVPGIILGHNENIAWGVTNYGPDVQDLYIEKQNPNNPYQYEYDGNYYDAEVKKYDLKIKGGTVEQFEVVYTKNGPIINELLKIKNESINDSQQFSMRWTALEPTKELEAIISINKAKNFTEFEQSLENFKAPAQNFVFADNQGNIAYKSNGLVPIRKKGNGILPVPGYDSKYGWEGYIPFNELPKIINPDNGFIATANTNTVEDYPYFASNVWAQPYRKARIDEFLNSKNDLTLQDMKDLQMDIENLYAREFLAKMIVYVDETQIDTKIINILESWNLKDDKDQSAPLIFHNWMLNIRNMIANNQMNEDVYKFMPHKEHYFDSLLRKALQNEKLTLIEDVGGLQHLLTTTLNNTINSLKQKNSDIDSWKWGNEHKLSFRHSLTTAVPMLSIFLNPEEKAISGSKITVQAASQNEKGIVNHGASWRYVYDFSTNQGHHIVGPGQSGHFMSPYYKDQVQNWIDGNYTVETLQQESYKHTLILEP